MVDCISLTTLLEFRVNIVNGPSLKVLMEWTDTLKVLNSQIETERLFCPSVLSHHVASLWHLGCSEKLDPLGDHCTRKDSLGHAGSTCLII